MKPVPVYDVFGYMFGDDEHRDMRRHGIPQWRLNDVVAYFTSRGFDGVLIERRGVTTLAAAEAQERERLSRPWTTLDPEESMRL